MADRPRPVTLIVLDGWGYSENRDGNAILDAKTPNWDRLWDTRPHALVDASGINVGLPQGQMGNSEVGHLNLGAGRVVHQDYTRITQAIDDGSFADIDAIRGVVTSAVESGGAIHMLGLLSPGGVHSHEDHIHAFARIAADAGVERLFMHAILDGRDMPPRSAQASLEKLEAVFDEAGAGTIASIIGRYFAMDRDKRWDRVRLAFDLYTNGDAAFEAKTAADALEQAYARGESDEFVKPTRIADAVVADGDSVVFLNYRADRARQLTHAFVSDDFDGFERRVRPKLGHFVTLTRYQAGLDAEVAFPPLDLHNCLGEFVSGLGLNQLRIAETEKYAHVTFFFNGGREQPFAREQRILVQSPQVATYDLAPEMSARELTDKLIAAIGGGTFDLIVCNFANADMVGHTGDHAATVTAIETLDTCIGRIAAALADAGGELLVTADHGNAEQMRSEATGQAHTAHTTNPVPLLYVGRDATLLPGGTLADIAPTLLALMGIEPPGEMRGRSLVRFTS